MPRLRRNINGSRIEGFYKGGWRRLAEAFVRNFFERDELGASLCVRVRGDVKVDLWGGAFGEKDERPWKEDTVTTVFSCTKGATALCAHILADRGKLELNAPVAEYWPEFARNGKDRATVAMMLNHSVGVPGFREPLKDKAFADWDYMVRRLEAEESFWDPGTRNGYHSLTFGWTVGELVRRASGKSLGAFFADEVAKPLNIDFWIGLPDKIEHRTAAVHPYTPSPGEELPEFANVAALSPDSIPARAIMNSGGYLDLREASSDDEGLRDLYAPNSRWAHAAEIGASGGVTNARGLAGLYDPLANKGRSLLSPKQIPFMNRVSASTMRDAVLLMPTRFSLGFMLSMDNRRRRLGAIESVILGSRAFGHVGFGGSIGFADPECGMSFGYVMNRMGPSILLDARGQSLVDAAYACIGYHSNRSGDWER